MKELKEYVASKKTEISEKTELSEVKENISNELEALHTVVESEIKEKIDNPNETPEEQKKDIDQIKEKGEKAKKAINEAKAHESLKDNEDSKKYLENVEKELGTKLDEATTKAEGENIDITKLTPEQKKAYLMEKNFPVQQAEIEKSFGKQGGDMINWIKENFGIGTAAGLAGFFLMFTKLGSLFGKKGAENKEAISININFWKKIFDIKDDLNEDQKKEMTKSFTLLQTLNHQKFTKATNEIYEKYKDKSSTEDIENKNKELIGSIEGMIKGEIKNDQFKFEDKEKTNILKVVDLMHHEGNQKLFKEHMGTNYTDKTSLGDYITQLQNTDEKLLQGIPTVGGIKQNEANTNDNGDEEGPEENSESTEKTSEQLKKERDEIISNAIKSATTMPLNIIYDDEFKKLCEKNNVELPEKISYEKGEILIGKSKFGVNFDVPFRVGMSSKEYLGTSKGGFGSAQVDGAHINNIKIDSTSQVTFEAEVQTHTYGLKQNVSKIEKYQLADLITTLLTKNKGEIHTFRKPNDNKAVPVKIIKIG